MISLNKKNYICFYGSLNQSIWNIFIKKIDTLNGTLCFLLGLNWLVLNMSNSWRKRVLSGTCKEPSRIENEIF